ncbi:YceI family protein [Pseudomonas sp. SP16.1]|uniref:YceI family protein n=1 Tax=Pseudomonas sp. SP16.1 TaxID=3458854 RepID=UPI0040467CE6
MLKKTLVALALGSALIGGQALAADYVIDKKGQHAFVNFKISHLGYSWLYGTFKDFDGKFSFDAAKPEASSVSVTLNTASVDTNHAERDKHIRSDDFLSVGKHPTATFESTAVKSTGEGTADISGNLTLNGVTKPVVIAAKFIGEGSDPWGGYRAGFEGSTTLKLKDFDIAMDLGPASETVELILSIEGIRQ